MDSREIMEREDALFESKLHEFDRFYALFRTRMEQMWHSDAAHIRQEIARIGEEMQSNRLMLDEAAAYSTSPVASVLADVRRSYVKRMEELQSILFGLVEQAEGDSADAAALYAEYAIDFAVQAERFAHAAVLQAIAMKKEKEAGEKEEKTECPMLAV